MREREDNLSSCERQGPTARCIPGKPLAGRPTVRRFGFLGVADEENSPLGVDPQHVWLETPPERCRRANPGKHCEQFEVPAPPLVQFTRSAHDASASLLCRSRSSSNMTWRVGLSSAGSPRRSA